MKLMVNSKIKYRPFILITKFLLVCFFFIFFLMLGIIGLRTLYVNSISNPSESFPLTLQWQIDLGNSTYERPTYYHDLVFLPVNNWKGTNLYALAPKSGKIFWTKRIESYSFIRCLIESYLVLSGNGPLTTLDIKTGDTIWSKNRRPYQSTCNQSNVFSSGVPRDSIAAYDLATGQLVWGETTPGKAFSTLAYNQETAEIVAQESTRPWEIYIIESMSGRLIKSYEKLVDPPTDNGFSVRGSMYLIDQGQLFIGGTVRNAQTGDIIHKEDRFTNFPPTVTNDAMYLSAYGEGIVAFDRSDYKVKWVYQPQPTTPLNPIAPVAILNHTGYVIFSDATLRAFDLESGQELGYWQMDSQDLWFWPICSFPPLLCNKLARVGLTASADMLFVSFGDGKVWAFGQG